MIFDKEFKIELANLSSKEKDKLILRLLKKDLKLAKRMYFEMVETASVDELRSDVEESLVSKIENFLKLYKRKAPGNFSVLLRSCSGEISAHVYTTKDKFGEPWLNLFLLNKFLQKFSENVERGTTRKHYTLGIYIISKIYKVLVLITKLEEDYKLEFKEELRNLGKLVGSNHFLMQTAIHNMLDVNWLIKGEIPEEIELIVKEVKANGGMR